MKLKHCSRAKPIGNALNNPGLGMQKKGHTVEFFKHITDDLSVTIPIQIGFHIVTIEVQFYLPKPQEFQTPRIKLTQK
uniref:Uncharacterized protein n=1 Tax=Anguilla anguilla TaxID=7936 RepID=A0A0E9RJD4_ANGAN